MEESWLIEMDGRALVGEMDGRELVGGVERNIFNNNISVIMKLFICLDSVKFENNILDPVVIIYYFQ